mgnify:CR=1 FL=1
MERSNSEYFKLLMNFNVPEIGTLETLMLMKTSHFLIHVESRLWWSTLCRRENRVQSFN